MQKISTGPLLDGLRKRPRHLNSQVVEATVQKQAFRLWDWNAAVS